MTGEPAVHRAAHDARVIGHLGPRPVDDRDVAVIVDGADRQILRLAGEQQDAARAGRVRDRAEQMLAKPSGVRAPDSARNS